MLLAGSGATLYYEVRGAGETLVFVCGGPTDADVFAPIADALAGRYRVVTYDPRGNSRSVIDPIVDQNMDVHGDDLARLIDEVGGPALVFGNSGGGMIGLNASARHPDKIRALIAHEPPCVTLLPDGAEVLAAMKHAHELGMREGVMAGFGAFMKLTGIDMTPPPGRKQETSERMRANLRFFVAHGIVPIASFRPDVKVLAQRRVIVGAGTESAGQLAHRTAVALAAALELPATPFPGGHGGYSRHVDAFAAAIAANFE